MGGGPGSIRATGRGQMRPVNGRPGSPKGQREAVPPPGEDPPTDGRVKTRFSSKVGVGFHPDRSPHLRQGHGTGRP